MQSYQPDHITVAHRCGHTVTYRIGHDWPGHRYCFTCSTQRADWIEQRIHPHIRTRAGRFAVLRIIQELLEHEFTREQRHADRDGGGGEIRPPSQ